MEQIKSIRKFIVAAVGVAVAFGILDHGVGQDVVAAATAIAVYFVPNG